MSRHHHADGARIVVTGEVDLVTAPILGEHVSGETADSVVLDLSKVTFIDSSGLRVLLNVSEELGTRLSIIPSPGSLRLIEITGLDDRLPIITP